MDSLKEFIPKLNYDDFYKFTISFCVITFILGIGGTVLVLLFPSPYPPWINGIALGTYLSFSVASCVFFIDGMKKWKANQEIINERLKLEVELERVKIAREIAEYAKQITEIGEKIDLSMVESIIAMSNPNINVSTVKTNKAIELIEKTRAMVRKERIKEHDVDEAVREVRQR